MVSLFQVGAGSGGMPVLDMLAQDRRISRVTLVEPDVFKEHNVERHLFPRSAAGKLKAKLDHRIVIHPLAGDARSVLALGGLSAFEHTVRHGPLAGAPTPTGSGPARATGP